MSNLIEFDREKSGISVRGLDIPGRSKDSDSKELSLSMEQDGRRGETYTLDKLYEASSLHIVCPMCMFLLFFHLVP